MKTVKFLRSSTPDNPELGYGDHVMVYDDGKEIYGGHASTCPNPYSVNRKSHAKPWTMLYGWIAEGEYKFQCRDHEKFGKCLLLNGGGKVDSCVPNPAHNGEMWMEEIFVHRGAIGSLNPKWRGSRGCCTIPPEEADRFFACFQPGETGKVIVRKLIA